MQKKEFEKLLNFSIINIDKPSGPTSFTVSSFVRNTLHKAGFKVSKTSHFGTLDPKVTGVLPIAINRACRLTGFFLGHDKTYVGVLKTHEKQDIEKLQEIINKKFLGVIKQKPPVKSSVKREVREREIKSFDLIEGDEEGKDFLFTTEVQGGTYIRKLCSDLGDLIGGAHMLELRRITAGIFDEVDSVDMYDFEAAVGEAKKGKFEDLAKMLVPAEDAIEKIMPKVHLSKKADMKSVMTGKPLFKEDLEIVPSSEVFAVFDGDDFLEIAAKTHDEGNMIAKPKFVLN